MKTYSNYMVQKGNAVSINEASAASLAAVTKEMVKDLPVRTRSESDIRKAAALCPNFKVLEKKLKGIGCSMKNPFIIFDTIGPKVGGYTDFEIVAPRDSKSSFWFRLLENSALTGFKDSFMKLSFYAQIQPDMYGADLDAAVKEITKVRDFVQWFNQQDLASMFPFFKDKGE